jgi:hypothetical protein
VNEAPRLERCPYDGTGVVADVYPGGFIVVSCESCGAAWELHNAFVRRVSDPAWISVDAVDGVDTSIDERLPATADPSV